MDDMNDSQESPDSLEKQEYAVTTGDMTQRSEVRKGRRWLSFLVGSHIPPVPEERQPCPYDGANFLSRWTWHWVTPLLRTGYLRTLVENDISLAPDFGLNENRMEIYDQFMARHTQKGMPRKKFIEFYAIAYVLRLDLISVALNGALVVSFEILSPVISRHFLQFVQNLYSGKQVNQENGVGLGIGTSLMSLGFSYTFINFQLRNKTIREGVRCVLLTAMYRKALKLSPAGRQQFSVSKMTSLSNSDILRIVNAAEKSTFVILFPITLGAVIGVLIWNLGPSALVGLAIIFVFFGLSLYLMKLVSSLRGKSIPFQDKRIGLIRETVQNMRIIKYYNWEKSFLDLIFAARKKEKDYLKLIAYITSILEGCLISVPQFGAVAAIGVRAALKQILTPALIFPSITLFNLFIPVTALMMMGLVSIAEAWKSFARLDEFFAAPEESNYVEYHSMDEYSVIMTNASFSWGEPAEDDDGNDKNRKNKFKNLLKRKQQKLIRKLNFAQKASAEKSRFVDLKTVVSKSKTATAGIAEDLVRVNSALDDINQAIDQEDLQVRAGAMKFQGLKNVNLKIKKGEFIVVVGGIGSGKTSLLSAIAGSMIKDDGEVEIDGSLSVCLDQWSINDTMRENITFGLPFDRQKYDETVRVCNLTSDLNLLGHGDLTEIGERGVTLSGGQKARLSLARSVYRDGDIFLLDDVLSAVDARVGKYILDDCLLGKLAHKTRILATHHLHMVDHADRVIYLDGRGNVFFDHVDKIRSNHPVFDSLLQNSGSENTSENGTKQTNFSENLEITENTSQKNDDADKKFTVIDDETKRDGRISWTVIKAYLIAGAGKLGYFPAMLVLLLFISAATSSSMSSIWLSFMTAQRYALSIGGYLGIYILLVSLVTVFRCTPQSLVAYLCFESSSNLHNTACEHVFRAPMFFFDRTPLGRIVTRFTEDVMNIDTVTFLLIINVVESLSELSASLVTTFVYVPYSLAMLVPIIAMFFICFSYYRQSAREIKRFDALFRSSMITHSTETFNGLPTIVSYGQEERFASIMSIKVNSMYGAFFLTVVNQCWLMFRLCLAAITISFLVTIMCSFRSFDISASSVGLLVTIVPQISMSLSFLVPLMADLENELNSVERVWEYGVKIPQEAPAVITEKQPPSDWPQAGKIEFKNASLKYRPELPDVLKNLSFTALPGEKIGICGRTGAGKSTILSALFRLTELSSGSIFIDDLDISQMGLSPLRSNLSIIPQEPVLFEGTIRSNLDPFGQYNEDDLWDALRRSGLIRKEELESPDILNHKFALDKKTNDDGSNYSLGERQLLTLARALVRQSKIIVLDEATATVDYDTDQRIQNTIASEFGDCTILCIAHRLKTIINHDKVFVLDGGELKEFDSPLNLFLNPESMFHSLCIYGNIKRSDFR